MILRNNYVRNPIRFLVNDVMSSTHVLVHFDPHCCQLCALTIFPSLKTVHATLATCLEARSNGRPNHWLSRSSEIDRRRRSLLKWNHHRWVGYDPDTKCQSYEWVGENSPPQISKIKSEDDVYCVFLTAKPFVPKELVEECCTVKAQYYQIVLDCLISWIRRVRLAF